MEHAELIQAAEDLQREVEVLRQLAEGSSHGHHQSPDMAVLMRNIARSAREVEAWGSHLTEPAALRSAEAARASLDQFQTPSAPSVPSPHCKVGAVLCFQVQHEPARDRNELVSSMKRWIFDLIALDPPVRPLRYSVGLLPMEEHAYRTWTRLAARCHVHESTLAPLLVTLMSPVGSLAEVELSDYLDQAAKASPPDLGAAVRMAAVVVELEPSTVCQLERRTVGRLLNGSLRAEL